MTTAPAYVVLGGAGRLGRHLLPKLSAQGHHVVCISRQPKVIAGSQPDWVQADLTALTQWPRTQERLLHLLDDKEEVVLVDLLLDRTSVTSMRRSIAAATAFTVGTRQILKASGVPVRVLAASTTASLAPLGLQTPYGRAKRQQALHYSRFDLVDLVLLPQLLEATRQGSPIGRAGGHSCTYEVAATALLAIGYHPARRSLWVVRGSKPHPYRQRGITGLPSALGALVLSHTVGWNSPAAHRWASHERLALLPPRIRAQVDHHGAPERLLHSLERHLAMPRTRTVIAGLQPAQPEEDHDQHS